MRVIKFLLVNLSIIFFFSAIGLMCPHGNGEQIKGLMDLKEEVAYLTKQLEQKKDERDKLQKEIAAKDAKLKNLQNQLSEILKRCP